MRSDRRLSKLADLTLKVAGLLVTVFGLSTLAVLLFDIASDGLGRLSWQFLTSFPSRRPEAAGIYAALT